MSRRPRAPALIHEIKALDQAGASWEFHILGTCDFPAGTGDAVIHGAYEREDFQTHVRRINPHIGAALSIWPETYLHTLSEMWAAGLPVLALRLGAMAERVGRRKGRGWLADPEPDGGLGARLHAQFTEIAREQAWTRPDKQPHLFRPAGDAPHGRRHGQPVCRALPERSGGAARLCPRTGTDRAGFFTRRSGPLRLDCLVRF